jgi:hypothetical protein
MKSKNVDVHADTPLKTPYILSILLIIDKIT